MSITSWEIDRRYIPLHGDEADDMWSDAEQMALQGWELVSAVPIIGSYPFTDKIITVGYTMLFKRPVDKVKE